MVRYTDVLGYYFGPLNYWNECRIEISNLDTFILIFIIHYYFAVIPIDIQQQKGQYLDFILVFATLIGRMLVTSTFCFKHKLSNWIELACLDFHTTITAIFKETHELEYLEAEGQRKSHWVFVFNQWREITRRVEALGSSLIYLPQCLQTSFEKERKKEEDYEQRNFVNDCCLVEWVNSTSPKITHNKKMISVVY